MPAQGQQEQDLPCHSVMLPRLQCSSFPTAADYLRKASSKVCMVAMAMLCAVQVASDVIPQQEATQVEGHCTSEF